MNVFIVFGERLANLLYILFIVGEVGARSALGARRTARLNMTNQNTKSNLIWVKILDQNSEIQNGRPKCTFWLYYLFIMRKFLLYYY